MLPRELQRKLILVLLLRIQGVSTQNRSPAFVRERCPSFLSALDEEMGCRSTSVPIDLLSRSHNSLSIYVSDNQSQATLVFRVTLGEVQGK